MRTSARFRWRQALATGADVVIAGRSTDTALALAPMVHRFGWGEDDFDKLAAGTIAGHIIECGAQCTGGNCQVDWQQYPGYGEHRLPDCGGRAGWIFLRDETPGGRRARHASIR